MKRTIHETALSAMEELKKQTDLGGILSASWDEGYGVTTLETDTFLLDKASKGISGILQEKLKNLQQHSMTIRAGSIFGGIFDGFGPEIRVDTRIYTDIEAKFCSEYTSLGTDRGMYNIALRVRTILHINCMLSESSSEIVVEILFVEDLIIDRSVE